MMLPLGKSEPDVHAAAAKPQAATSKTLRIL
jgi:hypothetical protein